MAPIRNLASGLGLALSLGLFVLTAEARPAGAETAPDRTGERLRIETGVEAFSNPKTLIKGLHRLFVGVPLSHGLHLGQGFYSAALGDAGGAFFWGVELVKTVPLGQRLELSAQAFLGGGGGAAQVVGDGLVKRAGLGLSYHLSDHLGLGLGASYIDISGAAIRGPAFGVTLSYQFGGRSTPAGGDGAGLDLRSAALGAGAVLARGTARSGVAQPNIGLIGAEAAFHLGRGRELVISADGGALNAEGYMQVMGGLRKRISFGGLGAEPGRLSAFGQISAGFGGGGDVDTGAGLLLGAGGGLAYRVTDGLDVELGLNALSAPDGNMDGLVTTLRLVRVFDRRGGPEGGKPQDWVFSLGLSAQAVHPGFHKPGTPGRGTVLMQESSLDLMLNRHFYLTGNAQTTMDGGVAGYAIGLLGLGWTHPIAPRWDLSVEGHLGAAGGGGVATAGGLVGGVRLEMDYALNERVKLSAGIGKMRTLKGGGMAPTVVQFGLKLPFTTH